MAYIKTHEYRNSSLTAITASTTASLLLPFNGLRSSFLLTLEGSGTAYIGFTEVPTTSSFSFSLRNKDYYEDSVSYKGEVYVIFSDDSNSVLYVTEIN